MIDITIREPVRIVPFHTHLPNHQDSSRMNRNIFQRTFFGSAFLIFVTFISAQEAEVLFDGSKDENLLKNQFILHGDPKRMIIEGKTIHLVNPTDAQVYLTMNSKFGLTGNFEIEIGYEVLQQKHPTKGYGISAGIWVHGDESQPAMGISRALRIDGADDYTSTDQRPRKDGKGLDYGGQSLPTKAVQGRMMLRRIGTKLFAFGADEKGEFKKVREMELWSTPVKHMRIYAEGGSAANSFDFRLGPVIVRKLPGATEEVFTEKVGFEIEKLPEKNRTQSKMMIAGVITLLLIVLMVVVLLVRSRSKRQD
jgi:hypothetical protein